MNTHRLPHPLSVAVILTATLATAVHAQAGALPRGTPESQGISSIELLEFVDAADTQIDAMNSFMLLRHGQVVAEGWWSPFDAGSNHMLYSLSKSFTSTAVGMAVAEGKLSIDDPVLTFFPDDAPAEVSNHLKNMRVRDLLTMSTGHQDETSSAADQISAQTFLAHPVPHLPGTHFKYNTPATFMLSAIVQKQTGQAVVDYLQPRLFEPLGIENPVWDANWQGISLGGYGLRVRTEDIAKLGQLYLQKGEWNGRQLIPEEWVKLATSKQVSNGSNPRSDWNQGYGFQFWRCQHNAFRGDGAFGQYCLVLPEQDAVIAITSGVRDMQGVLNLIWEKLLPAFRPVSLPANQAAVSRLQQKLGSLEMSTPEGAATSTQMSKFANRQFKFAPNDQKLESISIAKGSDAKSLELIVKADGKESRFPAGYGEWKQGRGNIGSLANEPVAGSMAWSGNDTCVIKLCANETPFYFTLNLKFDGDQLTLSGGSNVAFGPSNWPTLVGHAD